MRAKKDLSETASRGSQSESTAPRRILLPIHQLTYAGGLFRFERLARALPPRRWAFAWVCFSETERQLRETDLPVLTIDQAASEHWDAVMIPGAGFPHETIEKFALFQDERFGIRVQHVLNDQSRKNRFLKVNKAFKPHIVVFNNLSWPPGTYTDFTADRFYTLLGAVDSERFAPRVTTAAATKDRGWVIGAIANKNPEPILTALDHLPDSCVLRLFGVDKLGLASKHRQHIEEGRLELVGALDDAGLVSFYHSIDCFVSAEQHAGWCNHAAEAAACGVPLVCAPIGTEAFAVDGETALLLEEVSPKKIADQVQRLMLDEGLRRKLVDEARRSVEGYSWATYAEQLTKMLQSPTYSHYTHAPHLGLHGKWPISERLAGLEELFKRVRGASVLDLGAAEGIVSHALLEHGAERVDGFEMHAGRVAFANRLCRNYPNAHFAEADLSSWPDFVDRNGAKLADCYDVVLYLGLHHHLPPDSRRDVLAAACDRCSSLLAIRTPKEFYVSDEIEELMQYKGFEQLTASNHTDDHLGQPRIYIRHTAGKETV